MISIDKAAIIWSILIVFVAVGIAMFGNESEYVSVQNFHLNLLDGYWFVTASVTPTPAEIKFLDNGPFVVTVKDESDNVKETYVGTYALNVINHTLEMDLNSTVVLLSLYDVQPNSFSGSSVKPDLLMSFQRLY